MTIKPVALSSIHDSHLKLGAVMEENNGWLVPVHYSSKEIEVKQTCKSVGIVDVSFVDKFSITGKDIEIFLDKAFSGLVMPNVGTIKCVDVAFGTDTVKVSIARLVIDELLVSTIKNYDEFRKFIDVSENGCLHVTDLTSGLSVFRIIGPSSVKLLSCLTELDLSPLKFPDMSCTRTRFADVQCIILRKDFEELRGFELYVTREYAEYVWDSIFDAGIFFDLTPLGIEAMNELGG
jgi:heterotetrameric sarcosine oxidase gamma subunit